MVGQCDCDCDRRDETIETEKLDRTDLALPGLQVCGRAGSDFVAATPRRTWKSDDGAVAFASAPW